MTWDSSGSGTRLLAAATGRFDGTRVRFTRVSGPQTAGSYPALVAAGPGSWLRASTTVGSGESKIRLETFK